MEGSSDANETEKSLNRRRLALGLGLGFALITGGALASSALSTDVGATAPAPEPPTPPGAAAQTGADTPVRLAAGSRKAKRYRIKVAGSSVERGGAKIAVAAPSSLVTKTVENYGSYATFIPQFKKSEVVKRDGKFTDVRLEVPVLGGLTTFWAIVRFGPPEPLPAAKATDSKTPAPQVIRGRFIKGNLKSLDVAWRIHPTSASDTRLHLELHMVPKLPVPGSVVSGELESAADKGVTATRDRVEHQARQRKAK